ncbi:MAG: hypothetical protein HQL46_12565 [Gammaproteobacteria bacterium]|nr:hypothetical protein [Gammaproteobacteria bacterium]
MDNEIKEILIESGAETLAEAILNLIQYDDSYGDICDVYCYDARGI